MKYVYLGLSEKCKTAVKSHKLSYLELSIGIDGLPIFKSSKTTLWPVLCLINNIPSTVFAVALVMGENKPINTDFLIDTVDELHELMINGLAINGKDIPVTLTSVICDSPAKAMVKCVKLFSGYYGCDRCEVKGEYVMHRMTYPYTQAPAPLRTDLRFRQQANKQHHLGETPLCRLNIDMVQCFPFDYMHCVCLGVMKKLLEAWLNGSKAVKLSATEVSKLDEKLSYIKKKTPKDFVRKPRSVQEIDMWKATEFRLFLLYVGKVVLKSIVSDAVYQHFMKFSSAICILVSAELTIKHHRLAHRLLTDFVRETAEIYGNQFMVYNIHTLLHLTEDSLRYGSLENCSAFIFESYLGKMKRLVRSGKSPLVQMVKRLHEFDNMPDSQHIQENSKSISWTFPDNFYINDEQTSVYQVTSSTNMRDELNAPIWVCKVYSPLYAMFTSPCSSKLLGIFTASEQSCQTYHVSQTNLKNKAFLLRRTGKELTVQLLLHVQ